MTLDLIIWTDHEKKLVTCNNLSMEVNLSKSTILPTPMISGSTATIQTNISSEISSVSLSITLFLNSCDGHFSTTSNKNSGPFHQNFSLVLSNFAFHVEMSAGFSLDGT